jgi:hypothetical protein
VWVVLLIHRGRARDVPPASSNVTVTAMSQSYEEDPNSGELEALT